MFNAIKEIWQSISQKEKNYLKFGFLCISLLGVLSVIILPLIITQAAPYKWMDISQGGNVATTINGISTPLLTIGIGCLTFLAFWVQYKANVQQTEQFRKQDKDTKHDRFENKYYKLIDLHRLNVDDMAIGSYLKGRKCFVAMYYEFKHCYIIVSDFLDANIEIVGETGLYSKVDSVDFAYRLFFFGIGINSEKQLKYFFNDDEAKLYEECKRFMETIQRKYVNYVNSNPNQPYFTYNAPISGDVDERTVDFYYYPFDGHSDVLGHYYRHLFQAVGYVVNQPKDFLSKEEKYDYLKTLRAQLSNHEQLLLYYNSLSIGKEWQDTEYFRYYRMIKDLPFPLADFGKSAEEYFKQDIIDLKKLGIDMFNWQK